MTESNEIPRSLGEEIDALWEQRERIRQLESEVTSLNHQYSRAEAKLRERMVQENVTKAAGNRGIVSVTTSVVPTVKDWEKFHAFIRKHNYFHLLDRRASVTGCRELFETKGMIPGVEPFVKEKLRLTTGDDS